MTTSILERHLKGDAELIYHQIHPNLKAKWKKKVFMKLDERIRKTAIVLRNERCEKILVTIDNYKTTSYKTIRFSHFTYTHIYTFPQGKIEIRKKLHTSINVWSLVTLISTAQLEKVGKQKRFRGRPRASHKFQPSFPSKVPCEFITLLSNRPTALFPLFSLWDILYYFI